MGICYDIRYEILIENLNLMTDVLGTYCKTLILVKIINFDEYVILFILL